MKSSRPHQSRAARSADGFWAIVACGVLGFCLTAGIVTQMTLRSNWGGNGTAGGSADPSRSGVAQGGDAAITEAEKRAGSILFVPFRGDQCQYNLFDNISGQIWHSGYVSCDVALQRGSAEKTKSWSIARTDAIRGSFRWKAPNE